MIKTGMYENKKNPATDHQFSPEQTEEASATHNGSNGTLESAELLRWRADMLLDEMLLGGAEIGAGYHAGGTHVNGSLSNGALSNGAASPSYNGHQDPGRDSSPGSLHEGVNNTAPPAHQSSSYLGTPSHPHYSRPASAPGATEEPAHYNNRENNQSSSVQMNGSQTSDGVSASTQAPLLVSAEQRYARAMQPLPPSASDANINSIAPAGVEETGAQTSGLGPVRRSMTVGAMAVGNRGSKYTTLLPRESAPDPDALLQEIVALGNQIATDIPAAHESRERAQKLLDKANTILQSDPLRSAEVGYYLQQVRSMIERLRQNFSYSALYRRRLHAYLFAWVALAAVTIIGCMLYGRNLVDMLVAVADVESDSLVSQHLVALLLTIFAGGLGGTLGALWSVHTQTKQESFFLDRKFSLRNMVLPISGFVAGFFIYLLLGFLYWGFGFDPSRNFLIALIPVLLTFGLSSSQELMFGVRS